MQQQREIAASKVRRFLRKEKINILHLNPAMENDDSNNTPTQHTENNSIHLQ